MKKILAYIQSHFLLRNILLAVSFILVFTYFVSLMLNIFTRHNQKLIVPNFFGMTVQEAGAAADDADLEIMIVDSLYMPKSKPGTVLDQNPKEGAGVKSGRKIFITINSFRPKTETIPYVSGLSLRMAKSKLESKGFEIAQLIYKTDMATNNVLSQNWKGTPITRDSKVMAELGSGITLTVGRNPGAPLPIIPKVVGLTLREAKSRLWENSFNIGEIRYDSDISPDDYDKARIYKQTPSQESRSDFASKVSLWLTLDSKKMSSSSKEADEDSRKEVKVDTTSEEQMLKELGIE